MISDKQQREPLSARPSVAYGNDRDMCSKSGCFSSYSFFYFLFLFFKASESVGVNLFVMASPPRVHI